MIDIHFYQKAFDLKQRIMRGESFERGYLINKLEEFRSPNPVVYNIETTNACNMACKMCPRTTSMTRGVETISQDDFKMVVDQLKPWTLEEWGNWESFVERNYKIKRNAMQENHFFLYIIPKVIQLHGYGSPLLDRKIGERVDHLTKKGFDSYFSDNPTNIGLRGLERDIEIMEKGLGFIKYSIESTDDKVHKEIRGDASNFSEAYNKILQILDEKEKRNLKTRVVITMLDLNRPNQQEDWERLQEKFKGLDVYIYFKSEDQQWYKKEQGGERHGTSSIHWTEPCDFPWSSMTIKSNGEVAMCVEDYNNEIILGDIRKESLYDIWNGKRYNEFRESHMDLKPGIKCTEQCDMSLIGECLNNPPSNVP
jgi:radical SAM protein with 4Fe4S-binding SPASM domain